ncbi:MAG: penicillin-binding protein 2 [Rhodospirillales bacterium]
MHGDQERQKLFARRTVMLVGGKLALVSMLAGRMYYLQVVKAEQYKMLADENRISLRLLAPPRGRIIDRFGIPLADNKQNYRVMLVSEDTRGLGVNGALDLLDEIVPMSTGERRRILKEVRRNRSFVPVTLRENLEWEDVARIEVNAPDLPGVVIDEGQSRFYPYGRNLAHVLGYVSAVSEKEKTGDRLLELPGFRTGKSGVEKIHDLSLRGSGGSSEVEVNAYGRVIRELNRREGLPGAEVRMTIDTGLQLAVAKRLSKEASASAVVLDVHTGDVLSMVSHPSFDPNDFNRGLDVEDWNTLISNPAAPLSNKAIAGRYSPGSCFKMLVALTALERGVISPTGKVFCQGFTELGDTKFHCWRRGGHGLVDVVSAIAQSCDVYFYEIARRVGIDRIAEMARRFGFGDPTGIDLPGEKQGLVPTKAWKREARDQPWHQGETLLAGIGQGYVLATPLQLAVMTARLVNGGFAISPQLTKSVSTTGVHTVPDQHAFPKISVNPRHLAIVRDSMSQVVNSPHGTAHRSAIEDPRYTMGGKTGTVQVRRITKAERETGVRKNEDLPWKERDHALFVGFAPADNPRYAVSVVVEHGGGGSSVAAPIARDILLTAQRRQSARDIPISQSGGSQARFGSPEYDGDERAEGVVRAVVNEG